MLVGYGSSNKGYRLYDINAKKIFLCRDVISNETQSMPSEKESSTADTANEIQFQIPNSREEPEVQEEIPEPEIRNQVGTKELLTD